MHYVTKPCLKRKPTSMALVFQKILLNLYKICYSCFTSVCFWGMENSKGLTWLVWGEKRKKTPNFLYEHSKVQNVFNLLCKTVKLKAVIKGKKPMYLKKLQVTGELLWEQMKVTLRVHYLSWIIHWELNKAH